MIGFKMMDYMSQVGDYLAFLRQFRGGISAIKEGLG